MISQERLGGLSTHKLLLLFPHLICSWLVPERGEGAYAPPSPSVLGGVELRFG